jgi:hypothetical protein
VQGVPERVVMEILRWSSPSMARRDQHVVSELRNAGGEAMSDALWGARRRKPQLELQLAGRLWSKAGGQGRVAPPTPAAYPAGLSTAS